MPSIESTAENKYCFLFKAAVPTHSALNKVKFASIERCYHSYLEYKNIDDTRTLQM